MIRFHRFILNVNLKSLSIRRSLTTSARNQQPNNSDANSNTNAASTNAKQSEEFYDIVICGGGMVGTAMACALGQENLLRNLKVALIESSPEKKDYKAPEIHSNRVCALSQKTIEFFKQIGNFDFIETNRYGTVSHMHVWDATSDAYISFQDENISNLALIVENDLIQASLARMLPKYENVKVMHSNQVDQFKTMDQCVDIQLKDKKKIKTNLLIGSDGANSFIRDKANFAVTKWNYDQMAIVATLKLAQKATNETAWQRFLSTGPIALLPLSDEYSSLVWSIKKNLAKELMELSDDEFAHRVNQAFIEENYKNSLASSIENMVQNGFDFLRAVVPKSRDLITDREQSVRLLPPKIETCCAKTRATYPLSFLHANRYVSSRIALIGDAVHRIHPLAGQGVNLGFGDVMALTDALKENVNAGAEIGSSVYLEKYESRRQRQAFPKVVGVDLLNKLYTDVNYPIKFPLVASRTIGLTISNRVVPLKNFFISQAKA